MEKQFSPKSLESCFGCGAHMCMGCAQESIERSPAGLKLAEIGVRYSRFAWDDTDKFKKYLGDDVDPVKHGLHQAREVAIPLITAQNTSTKTRFTYKQARALVLTNVYHDAHEGYTGDVPYPDKTIESDMAELEVNQRVVKELGASAVLLGEMRGIMGDFKQQTFLGKAFNAVENIGYLETGLKAWELRMHPQLTHEEQAKAYSMGLNVVPGAADRVVQARWMFPYAHQVLMENSHAIREVRCS